MGKMMKREHCIIVVVDPEDFEDVNVDAYLKAMVDRMVYDSHKNGYPIRVKEISFVGFEGEG